MYKKLIKFLNFLLLTCKNYILWILLFKDNNVNIYFQNQIDFLYLKLIVITMCGLFIACCIYWDYTSDTENIKLVFCAVKDTIMQTALKEFNLA